MARLLTSFFTAWVCWVCCTTASAEVSTIKGVEATYAGRQLKLMKKTDDLVGLTQTLDSCKVDSAGNFQFSVSLAFPCQAYIESETVNAFFYIEPGKKYELNIPPFNERTLTQKLDPYFKPVEVMANIVGLKMGDFNYKLMEFEDAVDFYTMKHLACANNPDTILASIDQMKEIFADLYQDPFQGQFMEYRFLLMLNSSSQIYQDSLILRLDRLGVDEDNPAFWDVFNNLFENFISQTAGDRTQYLAFQRIIEEGNVKMYFALIKNRYQIYNPDLRELVAIKWLYDLLNQGQYDPFKVMELLQQVGGGVANKRNREILTQILYRSSLNMIGAPAPDFEMTDVSGKRQKLSDFFGKYIYLNFGNSMINQTQKDLEVLTRFQNDFKKDLEILNIGMYDTSTKIKNLSQRYAGKMHFAVADDSDKLKKLYTIESIPSFFLIDKDGNLLMTKGAEPTDELRILLQKIFKSK